MTTFTDGTITSPDNVIPFPSPLVRRIEKHPQFEGVKRRFEQGFAQLEAKRRRAAVIHILREEFLSEHLINSDHFIDAVIHRIEATDTDERPYVFISVNPNINPKMFL